MAADSEISLLTRGSALSKVTRKTWSSQPAGEEEDGDEEEEQEQPPVTLSPPEGGIPSPQLRCFEIESSSIHEVTAETRPSDATQAQLSLSFDASQASVRSTDTTLEFYDAPLSEEQEGEEGHKATETDDEVVMINIKELTENVEPEEQPSPTTQQLPLLTSEDLEREEEEAKDEEIFEDVMEIGLEQEVKNSEEVLSEKEDEQDVESSSKQEDAATLDHEAMSSHTQGNYFCRACSQQFIIRGGLLHTSFSEIKGVENIA